METSTPIDQMDNTKKILDEIDLCTSINSLNLSEKLEVNHQDVVGILKSLSSREEFIEMSMDQLETWELTPEGKEISENGSHEFLVYCAVPEKGVLLQELETINHNAKVGIRVAMSKNWLKSEKCSLGTNIYRKTDLKIDETQLHLLDIAQGRFSSVGVNLLNEYRKRKLITKKILKFYTITKGQNFMKLLKNVETDLTSNLLNDDQWKNCEFKQYNFCALGAIPENGALHPLLEMKDEVRRVFLDLGFEEMNTENYVESSFWNFDSLFQPQDHSARDSHDTFFLQFPSSSELSDVDGQYLERVHNVHEKGAYGSIGFQHPWKLEEAKRLILRTHTTSSSSRMLYKLAQQNCFQPKKYFSIDRVFRNEATDSTHLAEFHQIEGLVAAQCLSLAHLIGFLNDFFGRLGMKKIKFKPAFNPYTEPSMEVFSFHEGLNKWVEVGNSGIFRPEMLRSMGFSEDVSVIAWGLSLERPTMIKYNITNIRSLFGHKVDLRIVKNHRLCLL